MNTDRACPHCGGIMAIKQGPFGQFLGCIRYPACKGTRHMKTLQDNTLDPTAGDELKKLRMSGHRTLEEFCKTLGRTRSSAYRTMAKHMGISPDRAHFGMFNEDKCKKAIDILKGLMSYRPKYSNTRL